MSKKYFDLVTEEWIDVSWVDTAAGQPERVGLRSLFTRADEISGFRAPFAPAAAGLMRMLVVLAARITCLDTASPKRTWQQRRADLLAANRSGFDPDAVERVLGETDRLSLFGPHPLLQDPRLVDECKSSSGVGKFAWTRVAGANQVFLSHDRDDDPQPIPAAEAVWHLLAWMYYGPSGRCSSRKVNDVDKADTGAGPLRRTLSVHPWGANLYETLLLNQVYLRSEPGNPDAAMWESNLNDPLSVPPLDAGLARRLANRFRHAMLLVPDDTGQYVVDAYATWAWRQAHPPADDPYVPYQTNKKNERFPRYADADRAIWRDLDSLILHVPSEKPVFHPQVIVDLNGRPSLPAEVKRRLRIRVFGYDQDGQTRDKAFFEFTTPPVLSALDDSAFETRIEYAHEAGNSVGRHLEQTLNAVWKALVSNPKATASWTRPAVADYWTHAGKLFWDMVLDNAPLPPLPNTFIRLATGVYDAATATHAVNPRAISILENHRAKLFRGWRKESTNDRQDDKTATGTPATSRAGGGGPDAGLEKTDW